MSFLSKIFGNANNKAIKKFQSTIDLINQKEKQFNDLSDNELITFSLNLKKNNDGIEIDDLLIESVACIRESIRRVTGEWSYDVQLLGALTLHEGSIAEMKTGEGKTLVATLALYLNSILGDSCHLVTVNDYLARRDAQWYGRALKNLGLTVAVLQNNETYVLVDEISNSNSGYEYLEKAERKDAYLCDIIYGTNSEFGFDYLKDNMRVVFNEKVQNDLDFIIVDEVDSVLIDEARTPLIISGEAKDDLSQYNKFTKIVKKLIASIHFEIDEASRTVFLTEKGIEVIEDILKIDNLYSPESLSVLKYIESCLKAKSLYHKDKEYVVKNGQVIIVDTFTGRLQEGRRWSDGLHQAIEAKESVNVQQESMTYATITIQNYFRMYKKLSGMTGTAVTEAEEFAKIYNLDVYVIPTNMPTLRDDLPDFIYQSELSKFNAVAEDINLQVKEQRPVLVGTSSIESSEKLSKLLTSRRIKHDILNAKNHEREAAIVANAGKKGSVTIATNMAGRGTDIKLEAGVVELGGLYVIGTERHESRRIDNQLRGRSGRQGDPGTTRLYVSFEDELMKRFAPEWLSGAMTKIGMDDNTPIESKMVTRSIETAQTRVESNNFEARKYILEYDDVMNIHRSTIYTERENILEGINLKDKLFNLVFKEFEFLLSNFSIANSESLINLKQNVSFLLKEVEEAKINNVLKASPTQAADEFLILYKKEFEKFYNNFNQENVDRLIQFTFLSIIDQLWVQHLTAMDEMRRGIGLRAYGQIDPLVAFKKEALLMWEELGISIRSSILKSIVSQSYLTVDDQKIIPMNSNDLSKISNENSNSNLENNVSFQSINKVSRNTTCPCGSGLKYKKCHG